MKKLIYLIVSISLLALGGCKDDDNGTPPVDVRDYDMTFADGKGDMIADDEETPRGFNEYTLTLTGGKWTKKEAAESRAFLSTESEYELVLNIYAPAPQDASSPQIPSGTYRIGQKKGDLVPGSSDGTGTYLKDGDGNIYPFSVGYIQLDLLGTNDYNIETALGDGTSDILRCNFAGTIDFSGNIVFPEINVEFDNAKANYGGNKYDSTQDASGRFEIEMYKGDPGSEEYTLVKIMAYEPLKSFDGRLKEGKYSFSTQMRQPYSLELGDLFRFGSDTGGETPIGTPANTYYESTYDNDEQGIYFFQEGEMEITMSGNYYVIECKFVGTHIETKVKRDFNISFAGAIEIEDRSDVVFSTEFSKGSSMMWTRGIQAGNVLHVVGIYNITGMFTYEGLNIYLVSEVVDGIYIPEGRYTADPTNSGIKNTFFVGQRATDENGGMGGTRYYNDNLITGSRDDYHTYATAGIVEITMISTWVYKITATLSFQSPYSDRKFDDMYFEYEGQVNFSFYPGQD